MPQFKVFTDEQITVWQRVGLIIEAETEQQALELLRDGKAQIEYTGDVSPYWETEDHSNWDHDNVEIQSC